MIGRFAAVIALPFALCGTVAAQGYPTKPVRIVVPSAPGGGTDLIARYLAQLMTEIWGQTVITDNRSGGATTIGIGIVAKSPADGYTLLLTTVNFTYLPAIYAHKLPYDPVSDFAPVVRLATSDSLISVNPAVPDLPTAAAAGLPGYEYSGWYGLWAPAKTPPALVTRINADFNRALSAPKFSDHFRDAAIEPYGGSEKDFAAYVVSEIRKWSEVAKQAGIRVEE